jgi:anthranilate phosphoribosyltransferase
VVLNAAAAIAAYAGKFELSLHERIKSGLEQAVIAIDSGAASRLVLQWGELSKKISS